MSLATLGIAVTVAGLVLLLVAEATGRRGLKAFAKPLASAGFLAAALGFGALESAYGRVILTALVLSAAGDVFLIATRSRPLFAAGLGAFALSHLAFTAAFAVRGLDAVWLGLALAALALPAGLVARRLRPHVPDRLRGPVVFYVVVITVMVAGAFGAFGREAPGTLPAGALAFYLSDLAVARQRFVSATFWNKAWGLPLYYGAQLLLASTIAS